MNWLKSTKLVALLYCEMLVFIAVMQGNMDSGDFQLATTTIALAFIAGKFSEYKNKANGNGIS